MYGLSPQMSDSEADALCPVTSTHRRSIPGLALSMFSMIFPPDSSISMVGAKRVSAFILGPRMLLNTSLLKISFRWTTSGGAIMEASTRPVVT